MPRNTLGAALQLAVPALPCQTQLQETRILQYPRDWHSGPETGKGDLVLNRAKPQERED